MYLGGEKVLLVMKENFKRKIYGVFKNLVTRDFVKSPNKNYSINNSFTRKSSLFD